MTIDSAEAFSQQEPSKSYALWDRRRKLGVNLSLAERRLLLRAVDLLLINVALIAAVMIWSDFPRSPLALWANVKWFITLSAVWIILAAALDVYDLARAASMTQSILYAGLAALVTGFLYQAIPWLTPPAGRRLQVFGFVALVVGGIAAWRAFYAWFFHQPAFQHRVLVVGDGAASRSLVSELHAAASAERANPFRGTGYRVVGFVANGSDPLDDTSVGAPMLSPEQDFVHMARRLGVDEIIVTDEYGLSPSLREAIMDCRELGLPVTPLSAAYERLTARLPVEYASQDLSIVGGAAESPAARLYLAGKRVIDILIALAGIAVVAILSPWVVLGNALTSPGPLFYRQHRVGQGGRPFVLVKFRTMIPQAEGEVGAKWAADDDQRVTPMGRWLRRMRLDEFPQFINVLRGEMSVVGPRPERPQFVGELCRTLPLYRARHAVPPGITGWAQVRYDYGNSVEDARTKLEYDLYYIKHAGFYLDLLVFLQTIPVMLQSKGL
jgi:exopolysaccharide biosynthesis polyprenyl glycosylphosphotransferase